MRYLETTTVGIEALDAWPGNARRHATGVLAESARTNGQYRSIVARRKPDGALEILAGHGTRDAFREVGSDTLRVEVIECDDEEAARIVLIDNRGSDLAEYDDAALLELLSSLGGDLTGTGYDAAALADLEALLCAPVSLDGAVEWTDEDTDQVSMGRIDMVVPKELEARFFGILGEQLGENPAERLACLLDLLG